MRLLITGGKGVMAKALHDRFPDAVLVGRRLGDVTDAKQMLDLFHAIKPDVVIHCAAVTDHQCRDVGLVFRTNVLGTRNVLAACQSICAEPVYLSSHYVYGGEAPPGGYRENAVCDPIGLYAWSKYLGELAAQEYGALVIRGSWYTPEKLQLWSTNGVLSDAWCSRTSVGAAAAHIQQLVERKATGIYNIGGERRTFHDILVAEGYPARPIERAELSYRLPYTFPADTSVSTDKYDALVQSA